jgi:DNA mismatch repair protein MSH5
MVEEPIINIRHGRHLLQQLCVDNYIANDTRLEAGDGEISSMMIVTGANGSGKSAYGKQVALIVFMAQLGSFVPAERAEIGVCDKSMLQLKVWLG